VIVTGALLMFPIEAVTVAVPGVVFPASIETNPADTVIRLELLVVHVAT